MLSVGIQIGSIKQIISSCISQIFVSTNNTTLLQSCTLKYACKSTHKEYNLLSVSWEMSKRDLQHLLIYNVLSNNVEDVKNHI